MRNIRKPPAQHGGDPHAVYGEVEAVGTVIIRDAVLRHRHVFHAGTVAQPLHNLQKVLHVRLGIVAGLVALGLRGQAVEGKFIAMLRIEAHRLQPGADGDIRPVHQVPHHGEHHQQLHTQPEVGTPFVSYLSQ